jgi:hypothetical protein
MSNTDHLEAVILIQEAAYRARVRQIYTALANSAARLSKHEKAAPASRSGLILPHVIQGPGSWWQRWSGSCHNDWRKVR